MRAKTSSEENFRKIRTTTLIALFSDELLMNRMVLKGGNLLDLVYNISPRSSLDIDLSMDGDFSSEEREYIGDRIKTTISSAFADIGYAVFDYKFYEKPKKRKNIQRINWGGYAVEFKLIELSVMKETKKTDPAFRMRATVVGPRQLRTFKIDISRFEYCTAKDKQELEGTTIYVYTPTMAVFEKLRAICQQFPEYCISFKTHARTARARDFIDIYVISESFHLDWNAKGNGELLHKIFSAKAVHLGFISRIGEAREFHRQEFDLVKSTVDPSYELREFDFYVDYVIHKCEELEAAGII